MTREDPDRIRARQVPRVAALALALLILLAWPELEPRLRAPFSDIADYRYPASLQAATLLYALQWWLLGSAFGSVSARSTSSTRVERIDGPSGSWVPPRISDPSNWILRNLFRCAVILLLAWPVGFVMSSSGAAGFGADPKSAWAPWVTTIVALTIPGLYFARRDRGPFVDSTGSPARILPYLLLLVPAADRLLRTLSGSPTSPLEALPGLAFALGAPILSFAGFGLAELTTTERWVRGLWLGMLAFAAQRGASAADRAAGEDDGSDSGPLML